MAKVNVLRQVKLEGKWKLLPVAKVDGRLEWSRVLVGGKPVFVDEGTFYLEYRDEGRKRRAIGSVIREAKAALATQISVLELRKQGVAAPDAPQIRERRPVEGKTIRSVIEAYCKAPPVRLRKKSVATYTLSLRNFLDWCPKTHISQLDHTDIEGFMAHLVRRRGLSVSTARDRGRVLLPFLNSHGAAIEMARGSWPKVTQREPEVYEPAVLKALFAAAKRPAFILYQTFLLTGMRDQEVRFLTWEDFSARRSSLRVKKKPEMGFDPKNYEERTVPIPAVLVELLEEHRRSQGGKQELIFPTARNSSQGKQGGNPNKHMLRNLQVLAWRAGLNCGRCTSTRAKRPASCATDPVCGKFGLHRFRHTYATTLLRDGVDLVSVQKLLGHKDVMSTRRYLHALDSEDLLDKINSTSLTTQFV